MSRKLSWRRVTLMLALLPILGACAHRTATPATNTACTAFAPIGFSRLHDTEETIIAVKAHNAAWDAVCGLKQ